MAAGGKVRDAVAEDANWRSHIRAEVEAQKAFPREWGFLAVKDDDGRKEEVHSTGTFKYFDRGGFTMLQKAIPLKGEAADRARRVHQEHEAQMQTLGASGARPKNALESTFFSHSNRLGQIRGATPGFSTEYTKLGSRYTLEQFGISQHGVRESITKMA